MIRASFDSTKTGLEDLLNRANRGTLRLDDFQRGYIIWDDERITSLLARVSASSPKGTMTMLPTGHEHIQFKPWRPADTHGCLDGIGTEALVFATGVVAEGYDEESIDWGWGAEESFAEASS